MTDTTARPPATGSGVTDADAPVHLWPVLLASYVGQFLIVLDVSVVNVALPSMREALALGPSSLQWIVNAYALTFAGFLLLGGRLADLFGRKPVLLAGLGLFAAASLVGGLAQGGGPLIAARAAQGVGAAILAPVTLSLLTANIPEGTARTRAIAAWTAVGVSGGATGGLVGGALTDYASWRWVLLINVPIGLVVGAVVLLALREPGAAADRRPASRGLDIPGAVLVTGGVAALAYGVTETESSGWTSATALGWAGAGLLALAAFVAVEARSAHPLMPLRLFRVRSIAVGNLVTLASMVGGFAMWYFLTLYMQNVLGYSAVRTGLAFLPHTGALIAASQLTPALMARFGNRAMAVTGGLLAASGFGWQSAVLDADGTFLSAILGPGLVMSAGFALMMTPLTEAATSGASAEDAGGVAGLINTSRQIGSVLGLAVLGAIAAEAAVPAEGYADAFLAAAVITGASMLLVPLLPRSVARRA